MRAFTTTRRPIDQWCSGPRRFASLPVKTNPIVIDLDTLHQAPCGGRGWLVVEDWDGSDSSKGICEHVIVIGD